MTEKYSHNARSEHEEMRALLPRFIEIERRDGNAEEVYPELAAHIAECDLCRFTMSVVISDLPGYDAPPDSTLRAADLPFIRQPGRSTHTIRPGSHRANYSIHISFPFMPDPVTGTEQVARSTMAAELDIPVRGLLLGKHSLVFDDQEMGVTLTLYQDRVQPHTETYHIIADLVGRLPVINHEALMLIGQHVYSAPVIGQQIAFANVDLGNDPEQIILVLES